VKQIENLMTNFREDFLIKSEIQGSEGKIKTYTSKFLGEKTYISISETKWHMEEKFKRTPIWFSYSDGFLSLYIWKLAIFYDKRK
jgi:hypothetical protein